MTLQPTHEDLLSEFLEWLAAQSEPPADPDESLTEWLRARGESLTTH